MERTISTKVLGVTGVLDADDVADKVTERFRCGLGLGFEVAARESVR